jgi:hypothetical protein
VKAEPPHVDSCLRNDKQTVSMNVLLLSVHDLQVPCFYLSYIAPIICLTFPKSNIRQLNNPKA